MYDTNKLLLALAKKEWYEPLHRSSGTMWKHVMGHLMDGIEEMIIQVVRDENDEEEIEKRLELIAVYAALAFIAHEVTEKKEGGGLGEEIETFLAAVSKQFTTGE